jgi:hypothetical protein
MKSLAQYLAESEKTYEFIVRTIVEMSDDQLSKLERFLTKYNVESVSAPRKSILQKSPAGFGDVGPAEVYTLDVATKLSVAPYTLHEEISRATGVPLGALRVHYKAEGDLIEQDEQVEKENKKPTSLLADSNYKEAEKIKHKDYYGDDFIKAFVKKQPKSKLATEYKVK